MGLTAVNLEAQEMDEKDHVAIALLEANARNAEASLTRLEGKADAEFLELKSEMKSRTMPKALDQILAGLHLAV